MPCLLLPTFTHFLGFLTSSPTSFSQHNYSSRPPHSTLYANSNNSRCFLGEIGLADEKCYWIENEEDQNTTLPICLQCLPFDNTPHILYTSRNNGYTQGKASLCLHQLAEPILPPWGKAKMKVGRAAVGATKPPRTTSHSIGIVYACLPASQIFFYFLGVPSPPALCTTRQNLSPLGYIFILDCSKRDLRFNQLVSTVIPLTANST